MSTMRVPPNPVVIDYPLRLGFHLSDNAGTDAVNVTLHAVNDCLSDIRRNDGDEFAFICHVQRIKAENLARAFHFLADGNQIFLNSM